jgi:hypothetical protein
VVSAVALLLVVWAVMRSKKDVPQMQEEYRDMQ